jgi:type IV fimbrial biogenesis protein FimT
MTPRRHVQPAGFTLPELLIVVTVLGTLAALGASGFRNLRDATSMAAATWTVRNQLVLARSMAIGRREKIRVRLDSWGGLVVVAESGQRLATVGVGPGNDLPVDSIRVRPSTLRFNARGQAAPGSVYLYRGDRKARIVSNFLGRLRIETARIR